MGLPLASSLGLIQEPSLGVEQSVDCYLRQVDRTTKEISGRFFCHDGERCVGRWR